MIQVGIAKEQLMMQLFLANQQSVASIALFAAKSREFSADVTTTNNVPVNFNSNYQTHRSLFGVSLTLRQPPLRTTTRTTRMRTKMKRRRSARRNLL
jgi:hypothetical protein